jgi:hypothetical protein
MKLKTRSISRRSMMTDEQIRVYKRFIAIRDRIRDSNEWIPTKDVLRTVDVVGMNHPLFEMNDLYLEYQQAFQDWLAVEPEYRKVERMSAIRGDYGVSDTWEKTIAE